MSATEQGSKYLSGIFSLFFFFFQLSVHSPKSEESFQYLHFEMSCIYGYVNISLLDLKVFLTI